MLRRLLPRTRSAFESRTEIWREVGLGSEIDREVLTGLRETNEAHADSNGNRSGGTDTEVGAGRT